MELSKRLRAVAGKVTVGNCVADVGCDHGFVSIYLIENKIAPKVIAMDVNQGPLARAREHIEQYGYSDYIDTRLSDGCRELRDHEADTLLCAGMGGKLTIRILTEELKKVLAMKEWILQPQSEVMLVRKTVKALGFSIVWETMIYEDGKYYPIMKAIPTQEGAVETQTLVQDCFGPMLLKEQNNILYQYLQKEQKKCDEIVEKIRLRTAMTKINQKRIAEVEEMQGLIQEAFSFYD